MTNPLLRHSSWCKETAFNCHYWRRRPSWLQMIRLHIQKHLVCLLLQRKNRKPIETAQLKRSQSLGSYRQASPPPQQDTCQQQQPQWDLSPSSASPARDWGNIHQRCNWGGLQPLYLPCPLTPSLVIAVILAVLYPSICAVSDWHPKEVILLKSHPWKSG